MPITPEQKAQWVAALRSGQYQKCEGRLRQDTPAGPAFCSMGVLKEVCNVPSNSAYSISYKALDYAMQDELMDMNDGAGSHHGQPKSFVEIADYIEHCDGI